MLSARLTHNGSDSLTSRSSRLPPARDESLSHFNVAHFTALHATWLQQGRHHAGIVVSSQRRIGDVIRRLVNLGQTLDAESLIDRLEYLGDW